MDNFENVYGGVSGNVFGTVKGNVVGDVEGTINGLQWKKLYSEGIHDAVNAMQKKIEEQEDIIHNLLAELYEIQKQK